METPGTHIRETEKRHEQEALQLGPREYYYHFDHIPIAGGNKSHYGQSQHSHIIAFANKLLRVLLHYKRQ